MATGILALFALLALVTDDGKSRAPIGLDALADIGHLSLLRDFRCLQHSSYDRTGGNDDGFSGRYTHLRRAENGDYVIFDAEGPGCIYRIWSAMPPEGKVKFYFDNSTTPAIECEFRAMFEDKVPPFASPITGKSSGGWYSYLPMPFAKRCVIATEQQTGFLAIAYHKYDPGTPVTTFSPSKPDGKTVTLAEVQAKLSDLAAVERAMAPVALKRIELPSGRITQLADLRGPATLRVLRMKVHSNQEDALRRVVVRIYWDGATTPAVEAPLGDLVGTGYGDVRPGWNPGSHITPMRYAAVPFGITDEYCYIRFPMPFRRNARITVESGLAEDVELGWQAVVERGQVMSDQAYFHAQWKEHYTVEGQHVPLLETSGRGHYVGTVLSMQSPWWLTYLEGDEKFTVDGELRPSIHGTGTEDYFNCGWYYNQGPVVKPYHGITVIGDPQARTSQYRMHIPDLVPFQRSLKVEIEHGESNNKPDTYYAIVTYWYQDTPEHVRSYHLPAATALRFPGTVLTNYENMTNFNQLAASLDVEAGLQAGGGDARFVPLQQLAEGYHGPERFLLTSPVPGGYLRWDVGTEIEDRYIIEIMAMRRPDFGVVELVVDGQPTGQRFDLYGERFFHDMHLRSEPISLQPGPHVLELRVVGQNEKSSGYGMGLGAYKVQSAGSFPKQWNLIGGFPAGPDFGYSTDFGPESKVDLSATYQAGDQRIGWRTQDANGPLWLHEIVKPSSRSVAYLHTYVICPDQRTATALVSVDDAGKLWVNGELVWAVPGVNHMVADKYAVPVRLKKGTNEVLIKAGQGDGAWGVAFRIADPKGDLQYTPSRP